MNPAEFFCRVFVTNSIQESKFEYSEMLIAERYFNVLVSVPLPPSLKGSEIDPLAAFETLNLELEKGTLPKEKDTKKPDKKRIQE